MCAEAPCHQEASHHIFTCPWTACLIFRDYKRGALLLFSPPFFPLCSSFVPFGVCSFYLSVDLWLEAVSALSGCCPTSVEENLPTYSVLFLLPPGPPKLGRWNKPVKNLLPLLTFAGEDFTLLMNYISYTPLFFG